MRLQNPSKQKRLSLSINELKMCVIRFLLLRFTLSWTLDCFFFFLQNQCSICKSETILSFEKNYYLTGSNGRMEREVDHGIPLPYLR